MLFRSTGAYNVFMGEYAGYYVTTGAKNTIIGKYSGNQGGLDIRTASNYIVLSDGDGNPRQLNTPNSTWRNQYTFIGSGWKALPNNTTTSLFIIRGFTGTTAYGSLRIDFILDQPGTNNYQGSIVGRAFWNGGTALFDGTTTQGQTLTWSVSGSGTDLTIYVKQVQGVTCNLTWTAYLTMEKTGSSNDFQSASADIIPQ